MRSRKKTLDFLLAMTILLGMSSLPFLHELIIQKDGTIFSWVPNWNIENTLTDSNGKVLGYSQYRVFLYFILIQVYCLIAWLGWFSVSKTKSYRFAILLGVLSSTYHIILILTNGRKTDFNNFEIKLIGTAIIGCILFIAYFYLEKSKKIKLQNALKVFGHTAKKSVTFKIVLVWLILFIASTGPYFHDIITSREIGVKDWIPQLGIENLLTDSEGRVWGFNSYRILLLSLSLQIFAQIAWAGWLHDSAYKLYRPFLVVPVCLSLYQIVVILLRRTDTGLNSPDLKLALILAVSAIICFFYFFKNKRFNNNVKKTSTTFQSLQNSNHK